MPVYTETKTYHTKAHMGMIDVTDDFRAAVQNACRKTGMQSGTITGFTTGGVAGLLNRLQIQLVFAAVNSQRRTHLRPDYLKNRLLQINHFYPYPVTRKIFCHFGMTAVKPCPVSK